MEENKELETTTEEQASVTPAANNGEKKGLFLSGLIVGFAATLLIVGGIFIAFQIHNIMTMKEKIPRSMHRPLKNCNCWKTL